MKTWELGIVVVFLSLVIIVGCSLGDVSGTYHQNGGTIKLTKEKKLILVNSGEVFDYAVEGNKIIVTNPMFGGAEGKIEENKLVFPKAAGYAAESLQGTWIKE